VLAADYVLSTEIQGVVNPITAKLYSGGGSSYDDDDDEPMRDHDEL